MKNEFAKKVWLTLSSINVNEHTDKKGNLTYLSWAWAYATLMKHYPASDFTFLEPISFEDGSMEVWCQLTVSDGENSISRHMWLPVMDHRNNSIKNPDSRKISDTRMRCLTKCMALFGLGHYIYAGEDIPDPELADALEKAEYKLLVEEHKASIEAIKDSIANEEYSYGYEAWCELGEDIQRALWKAPTKGGCFTTREREIMKTPEFRGD